MTLWFHSAILATSVAATVAVGVASASIIADSTVEIAGKTDKLPIADANATAYLTVETRQDGISVLNRIPVTEFN